MYLFNGDSTHLHVLIAFDAEAREDAAYDEKFCSVCSLLHFLAAAAPPSFCPSNFRCSFRLLWAASLLRTESSDLAATLAVTILPTACIFPFGC